MSVQNISSGSYIYQPSTLNIGASTPAVRDSDGDNDGSGVSGAAGQSGRAGLFSSAIGQALAQIGVSVSSSATADGSSSSTNQDPQQALSAFMHDLFAALHSQGGHQAGAQGAAQGGVDSDGDHDGSRGVSGASGHSHHHGGGGASEIASKLQSLVQQLSSSDSTGTGSSKPALATLQQDFQGLLSSQGVSGNQATLGNFLQALSQTLQGANPAGNIVKTQA